MDPSVEQFMPQSIVENNRAVSWQLVGLNSCLWLGKEMVKENPAKITVICRVCSRLLPLGATLLVSHWGEKIDFIQLIQPITKQKNIEKTIANPDVEGLQKQYLSLL